MFLNDPEFDASLTPPSPGATLDGMDILLEATALPDANPAQYLHAAAAAGADGLIVDGAPGDRAWAGWKEAARASESAGLRLIPRVPLELPARVGPPREWRAFKVLSDRPVVILRVRSTDNLDRAYRDAIAALEPIITSLLDVGIQPILEPAGTLARSRELWFIREAMDQAAGPDAMTLAWRPLEPALPTDAPSVAIMRLIRSLGLVFLPPLPPEDQRPRPAAGEGKAWIPLPQEGSAAAGVFVVEQLKGMAYDRMICLSAPRGGGPEVDWSAAVAEFRAEWARPPIPLSAYKGDKNAPRFASPAASPAVAPAAARPGEPARESSVGTPA